MYIKSKQWLMSAYKDDNFRSLTSYRDVKESNINLGLSAEIDNFRSQYFKKVIQDEERKHRELKHAQTNCFHLYKIFEYDQNTNQILKTCSKCGHSLPQPFFPTKSKNSSNSNCTIT